MYSTIIINKWQEIFEGNDYAYRIYCSEPPYALRHVRYPTLWKIQFDEADGGAYGIEASVITTVVLALAAALIVDAGMTGYEGSNTYPVQFKADEE